jgi:hypothetical protein
MKREKMRAALQRMHLATPQGLLCLSLLIILPLIISVPLVAWLMNSKV